jgi:class 3 adenylate cyclase/predicted ATPase
MDVLSWLRDLGLENYAQTFRANHIDSPVLSQLTAEDLIALGVTSVGHRRKLLHAIARLHHQTPRPFAQPIAAPIRPIQPERRQLSVLFCDLVGSTELAARLDPEDLGDVMRDYQAACTDVIGWFDGYVAKFLGDGALVYFGWPRAHEDDAERAVRAGLALVEAVVQLERDQEIRLQARVGIATGQVVVGDLVGEGAVRDEAVVGETPNLAARLQALAKPGTVVISQATRRLVSGLFELEDLGPRRLKGFAEPLAAWQVQGEGRAEGRFEARHTAALTPLVGRPEEIALLLRRWEQARDGEGQVVLLSGEPGIGKSRIVREVRARLEGEPHVRLLCQCSPYHQTSPLHPVIAQLERAAGLERDDPPGARLDKLATLLARGTDRLDESVPLIAALLGLPTEDRYPPLDLTPQRQKQRTLKVLVDQLEGMAAAQPVLVAYEDVHWIDPTTQELLGMAIERIQRLPVLALITFRPEFSPPWSRQPHVSALVLTRLGRRDAAMMVEQVVGDKALPDEVAAQIVAKMDGVPLFVEELTKTVLESGLLRDAGDCYELTGPLPPLAIPSTLHDSLLARLDRLAPVKEVAQIGATIGREFSHALLAAVADLPESELKAVLDQLVAAELVFRRGTAPDVTYSFKHALVQDAAYSTLLKRRRQQLHARIRHLLEVQFPEIRSTRPEIIAYHSARAGLFERAAIYWLKAGQLAAERSASIEAIAHLTEGIRALSKLGDTPWRTRHELRCQLALGPALLATRGWSTPEAAEAYRRARELCEKLGEDRERFAASWGLWLLHSTRGETRHAHELTKELFEVAERLDDTGLRLQAHHAAWADLTWMGDPRTACEHVRKGLALYDPKEHRPHALLYGGHDPGVCGKGQGGLALWLLGHPDQAEQSASEAVHLAEDLRHAPSLAHALFWIALCHQFRQDGPEAWAYSERLIALASEQELALYRACGLITRGWARVRRGEGCEGIRELREGLDFYTEAEVKLLLSYFRTVLADCYHRIGKSELALISIDGALSIANQTSEHFWHAAILQLKGDIVLALDHFGEAHAEVCFRAAINLARTQGAKSLELRAATSLARLWRDQGSRAEAHNLLAPVYGWFTEGFGTADLIDAKALLDGLG